VQGVDSIAEKNSEIEELVIYDITLAQNIKQRFLQRGCGYRKIIKQFSGNIICSMFFVIRKFPCQPTKVTPLYDNVVALIRADVAVNGMIEKNWCWCWKWPLMVEIAVTSKVAVLHLWCHHHILIK
jgi:hypothetical protein